MSKILVHMHIIPMTLQMSAIVIGMKNLYVKAEKRYIQQNKRIG